MNEEAGKAKYGTQATAITEVGQHLTRQAEIQGPYRYALRRIWNSGKSLTVIGLNPSTADAMKDDNTIRLLVNYGQRLGFGSLTMLNLYAWRTSRPAELIKASKDNDVVGALNSFEHLRTRIMQSDSPYVFAAWGKHGLKRGHDFARFMGEEWCMHHLKAFAINKDGSPHHPLYLKMTDAIHPLTIDKSIFYVP